MRKKERPVRALKRREDVVRVGNYLRDNYYNGAMLRLIWIIGCNTGLRASDICDLTASQLSGSTFDIVERKTSKQRCVYLNDLVQREIAQYFSGVQRVTQTRTGTRVSVTRTMYVLSDTPVFSGIRGGTISVKYMHYVISDACEQLGIRGNYGSHTMRYTFAYHAYKRCRDITRVKALLNHSTVDVTKIYLRGTKIAKKGNVSDMSDEEICAVDLG